MTSGCVSTSAAASSGSRSERPSAARKSRARLRPSTQPRPRNASRKRAKSCVAAGDNSPGHNTPTRATLSAGCAPAPCWTATARTASARAPATERRFMCGSPPPCKRSGYAWRRCRLQSVSDLLVQSGRTAGSDGLRTSRASFDDLVRAGQDRWRDRQAERHGGLEVDDQLECRRLLHWQIGGLGALEDLSSVN